jgi:hypothetical protein
VRPLAGRARKTALTVHVSSSVGWLGAVVAFIPLAVAANVSDDEATVRSAIVSMELMAWWALVPLSIAAFASGILQSLGSKWGLLRHYWVVFKLLITVVATGVLLLYTQTLEVLAAVARSDASGSAQSFSPLLHSGIALVLLTLATVLAIFKPRGITPIGARRG